MTKSFSPRHCGHSMHAPAHMGPNQVAPAHMAPTQVAPARRVVHPTRVVQRPMTIRYPVENVYPTHVKTVRRHVCEKYCSYPVSESTHDTYHEVDYCGPTAAADYPTADYPAADYPTADYPTAGYPGKHKYR